MITSTGNAAVKAARKLARRTERERTGLVLVEGPQAVGEAVGWLRQLFVTPDAAAVHGPLVARAARDGGEVLQVSERVLDSLAGTVTPQGMVGVAAVPRPDLAEALDRAEGPPLVVVLVETRDPGNAGTVIRSADAAGADVVVLTAASVDPGNPKAVRASAGSLFHLPVVSGMAADAVLALCRARGIQTVATTPHAAHTLDEADLGRPTALLFGGEAQGLSATLIGRCDLAVRIPMHGRTRPGYRGSAESLNLAATASVALFEAARQRAGSGVS